MLKVEDGRTIGQVIRHERPVVMDSVNRLAERMNRPDLKITTNEASAIVAFCMYDIFPYDYFAVGTEEAKFNEQLIKIVKRVEESVAFKSAYRKRLTMSGYE